MGSLPTGAPTAAHAGTDLRANCCRMSFRAPVQGGYRGAREEERSGFFNTGVSAYEAPNRGVYEQTHRVEDIGKFKAPTLRNIAVTAPYMHDGSIATLDEVIDHYASGGRFDHPNKTHILHRFALTDADRHDVVEFLKTLTDEQLLHDPRWNDPWQKESAGKTGGSTR